MTDIAIFRVVFKQLLTFFETLRFQKFLCVPFLVGVFNNKRARLLQSLVFSRRFFDKRAGYYSHSFLVGAFLLLVFLFSLRQTYFYLSDER